MPRHEKRRGKEVGITMFSGEDEKGKKRKGGKSSPRKNKEKEKNLFPTQKVKKREKRVKDSTAPE